MCDIIGKPIFRKVNEINEERKITGNRWAIAEEHYVSRKDDIPSGPGAELADN